MQTNNVILNNLCKIIIEKAYRMKYVYMTVPQAYIYIHI